MKCGGVSPGAPAVRIEEKKQTRGVRGDEPRFPQAESHNSPDSVIYLPDYHPLPPLSPWASPEEQAQHECQEVYRQCMFKLRWSKRQRDEYVAQHFEGRRFYQLTLEEQWLLIYRLRALLAEYDFVGDLPHGLFSCCDPVQVCRSSGTTMPSELPKPAQVRALSPPKKRTDRIFKNKYLKEQQTEQNAVVGSPNEFDLEGSIQPRSEKASQKGSNGSDTAEPVDRDEISAALAASCNDEFFVRKYVLQASEADLRSLQLLLDRANEAEVRDAIAAMKEQQPRLRAPIRWLISAIKKKFKPNRDQTPAGSGKVDQWRRLAVSTGVISASMLDRDVEGGGMAFHNSRQVPLAQAMERWPYEWLLTLPEDCKSLLARALADFDRGNFQEVDEKLRQINMYRSRDGYFLPVPPEISDLDQ